MPQEMAVCSIILCIYLDRTRGIEAHTQEWLRRIMTDEAVIGKEPPTEAE